MKVITDERFNDRESSPCRWPALGKTGWDCGQESVIPIHNITIRDWLIPND